MNFIGQVTIKHYWKTYCLELWMKLLQWQHF